MSSVGRSGEDGSQLREFYMQREAERDKVHQDEVKKVRQEGDEALTRANEQSKKQMEEMRQRDHEKMSQQDLQHQRDIEALKAMYKRKVEDASKG